MASVRQPGEPRHARVRFPAATRPIWFDSRSVGIGFLTLVTESLGHMVGDIRLVIIGIIYAFRPSLPIWGRPREDVAIGRWPLSGTNLRQCNRDWRRLLRRGWVPCQVMVLFGAAVGIDVR